MKHVRQHSIYRLYIYLQIKSFIRILRIILIIGFVRLVTHHYLFHISLTRINFISDDIIQAKYNTFTECELREKIPGSCKCGLTVSHHRLTKKHHLLLMSISSNTRITALFTEFYFYLQDQRRRTLLYNSCCTENIRYIYVSCVTL